MARRLLRKISEMRQGTPLLRRQYLIAAGVFAVLLVGTFGLFLQLLIGQFSRGYLEEVLLSGKAQAQDLAREMRGESSIYQVVEHRKKALTTIAGALAMQEMVETVQIFDDRGKLVWQWTANLEGTAGSFPNGLAELAYPDKRDAVNETTSTYQFRAPLSDLGTIVMSYSKPVVESRIALLRKQLIFNTAIAAGVALLVMSSSIVFSWHLIQRNAALEERRHQDQKLAALGSLAANLAHEIRNPLNGLSLNLEMLEEDLTVRSAGSDTVGLARREVGRLSRLVNDFLVYARPTPVTAEPVDAGALLHEVEALLAPECQRAGVRMDVATTEIPLRIDRAQMSQVLINLSLNAVQAMIDSPHKELALVAREQAGGAIIEVIDRGPGIPNEELERVREAFYSRRKGGTGLGLAIADRIVQAHGGTLELENRPEGGLIARVRLPKADVSRDATA